jgi:FliG C-terminal domain
MSMLSRYQKPGGFIQLLQLIETCGKAKQENFLNIVEGEDIRWAQAIKEKMLTVEKIISWDDTVLAEIAARLQPLSLATFLHGLKKEDGDRLLRTFSHAQKRNIDDLFTSKKPNAAEINAAYLKVLQEVRYMIMHAFIRVDKFAPEMVIPEDIEDTLGKPLHIQTPHTAQHMPTNSRGPVKIHAVDGPGSDDVPHLRSQVVSLSHENEQLKNDLRVAREKLAQIKKIA